MTLNELVERGYADEEVIAVYFHAPSSQYCDVQFFRNRMYLWERGSGGNAQDFAHDFEVLGYKVERYLGRVHVPTGIFTDTKTGETHIDGWHFMNTCPPRLKGKITHVHVGHWNKEGEIYARHGSCWTEAAIKERDEYRQKAVQGQHAQTC